MTVIKKQAGMAGKKKVTFSTTRIVVQNIPKVAAWAQRFADDLLDKDDDEVPFSRNDLSIARDSGVLPSAGGANEQLRLRSCI
jgi:hypothetical protein